MKGKDLANFRKTKIYVLLQSTWKRKRPINLAVQRQQDCFIARFLIQNVLWMV